MEDETNWDRKSTKKTKKIVVLFLRTGKISLLGSAHAGMLVELGPDITCY